MLLGSLSYYEIGQKTDASRALKLVPVDGPTVSVLNKGIRREEEVMMNFDEPLYTKTKGAVLLVALGALGSWGLHDFRIWLEKKLICSRQDWFIKNPRMQSIGFLSATSVQNP